MQRYVMSLPFQSIQPTGKRKSLRERDPSKTYNEDDQEPEEEEEKQTGLEALKGVIKQQKAKKKRESTPTEGAGISNTFSYIYLHVRLY